MRLDFDIRDFKYNYFDAYGLLDILDDDRIGESSGRHDILTPPTYMKMISGQGPSSSQIRSWLSHVPHILLYVTTTGITENSPEAADVLYMYPCDIMSRPSSSAHRLFKSRGVFVTLCQLIGQVTGNGEKPQVTSVLLDGNDNEDTEATMNESQLIHIGYEEENGDLLLLALPGNNILYTMLIRELYFIYIIF